MCDIAHTSASHAHEIAPYEHPHRHPHNPLHAIKKSQSHSEKIAPCERALRFNPVLSKTGTHLIGAAESINRELRVNKKEIRALSSKLKRKSFAN